MRQDAHYEEKGATLVDEVWSSSDVIVKIDGPTEDEVKKLGSKHLIAQCNARINPDLIKSMNANGATVLSQDMLMNSVRIKWLAQNVTVLDLTLTDPHLVHS